MSGSQSRSDDALAGAIITLVVIVAIVLTIVAVWLAVRAGNALVNAFALRPRSRVLWGLVALLAVCLTLAFATQAAFWWAALVVALLLVACARMIVVSSEPVFRDPARHEFLNDVMRDWWPEVPGRGWAELE